MSAQRPTPHAPPGTPPVPPPDLSQPPPMTEPPPPIPTPRQVADEFEHRHRRLAVEYRTAVGSRIPKQDCTSCRGTSRPDRPHSGLFCWIAVVAPQLSADARGVTTTRPAAARHWPAAG